MDSLSLQQVLVDNFREEGAAQRVVARTGGFGRAGQAQRAQAQMRTVMLMSMLYQHTALAGALSGATIAAWRFAPAIPAAFHSSLSTASTAFVFFCASASSL